MPQSFRFSVSAYAILCKTATTKSTVTALHQFLAKKRQERTRGKLAGLETQIQELKELGASYREIAEYLFQEHGLTVTPSGLQKHLKSLKTKLANNAAIEASAPAPAPASVQPARPTTESHPAPLGPPPGNASPPHEVFKEERQVEGARIQNRGELPTDDVVARYRLGSPEHQEVLATYRHRKTHSQT